MAAIDSARLCELDQLLGTAFGPRGRAVLCRNPTGQMAITRSGIGILEAAYSDGDTPFMKTILKCADKVDKALGDGVKSFVFTTAALLKCFKDLEGKSRICRQLSVLQSGLSQLSIKSYYELTGDCLYLYVISTFFSTRFTGTVGLFLSSFFHQWISMSSACICSGNPFNISLLCKDFSNLCCYENGASRSVTDSCTKTGFLINGRVFNGTNLGPRKLIIATFSDSDSEDGRFDGLDIKCEINQLLSDLKRERAQDEVSLCPNVLLLSTQVLSDLTLFNLGRENVGVIHGAPLEEINFLEGKLLSMLQDGCRTPSDLIVDVNFGKGHVVIGLPAIHQIFICGPTKELRLEYALACRSVLRLLTETNESTLCNVCTKGGGQFERTMHQIISVKFDKFNNNIPRFSSRADLLNWHQQKMSHEKVESNEFTSAFTKISDVFSCLDRDVLDSVLEGILAVPCKLPKDDVVSMKTCEPVSLRLGILIHALSAVIVLLRCDHVIVSKKPC